MNAVRIVSMLMWQVGELAVNHSEGNLWSIGVVASLCGLIPEMYYLASGVAQPGLPSSGMGDA